MTEAQRDSPESLEMELATFEAEWSQIEISFVGPAPDRLMEPTDWAQATAPHPMTHARDQEPFRVAWNETVRQVHAVFFDRFANWAVKVVASLGIDRFEIFDIPDPPLDLLPWKSRPNVTRVAWLTGTADIVRAGKWI